MEKSYLKEYFKRIFDAKYRWQLWTAEELQQTVQNPPRFWDDAEHYGRRTICDHMVLWCGSA